MAAGVDRTNRLFVPGVAALGSAIGVIMFAVLGTVVGQPDMLTVGLGAVVGRRRGGERTRSPTCSCGRATGRSARRRWARPGGARSCPGTVRDPTIAAPSHGRRPTLSPARPHTRPTAPAGQAPAEDAPSSERERRCVGGLSPGGSLPAEPADGGDRPGVPGPVRDHGAAPLEPAGDRAEECNGGREPEPDPDGRRPGPRVVRSSTATTGCSSGTRCSSRSCCPATRPPPTPASSPRWRPWSARRRPRCSAALKDSQYNVYQPVPVLTGAPMATIQYLDEHQAEFPGVSVQQTTVAHLSPGRRRTGHPCVGLRGCRSRAAELKENPNAGYSAVEPGRPERARAPVRAVSAGGGRQGRALGQRRRTRWSAPCTSRPPRRATSW